MCFESLAITFRRSSLVSTVEAKAWKFSVAADASTEGSGRSGFRSWQTVCHVAYGVLNFGIWKTRKHFKNLSWYVPFDWFSSSNSWSLSSFFSSCVSLSGSTTSSSVPCSSSWISASSQVEASASFQTSVPYSVIIIFGYITDDSLVCWGLDFYWLWLSISMIMLSRLCHEKRDWSKRMAFAYRMLYMQHMAAVNCPPDLANLNYYVLQLLHLCMTWPVTQTWCPYMFLNHII